MSPNLVNGEAQKGQTVPPAPAGVIDTLRHLRARSPQESLGVESNRGLFKAFVLATLLTGVALAALTVGPYYWNKLKPAAPPAAPANPADSSPTPPAPAPAPSTTPDQTAKGPNANPVTPKPKGKDVTDVLGESGVKTGTPKVNPLDKKDDDIFKELNNPK